MNREHMMPLIKNDLRRLALTPSPTGFTHMAEKLLMDELSSLGFSPWQSNKGGVMVCLNPKAPGKGLLLSAHIDTLGLMVRSVKQNGRLRVTTVGGFPLQYVEQENVLIHTASGKTVPGTMRMNEPAVHGRRDLDTAERRDDAMEIVPDIKTKSKEETLAAGIAAGDFVSLDPRYTESGEGFIKSRHMDDKASAALLLTLARAVKTGEITLTRPTYLLFTNYEEVGHGASAAHPEGVADMIAVDMGVVADDLETDEFTVSICAKDSSGPYNYALTRELVNLAQKNGLRYALDVYPFYGSDAGAALRAGYDYRHALIGTGVAASHGYERVHEDGLWDTFRLIAAYVSQTV